MSNPASQMTLEALRSVPLFASLDDQAASELRNLLSEQDVAGNTRLFKQGDQGDAMYLIESGKVRISIRDEDKQEVTLAELAQGDFFGEMSLIDGRQRSADARVIEDGRLAILSRTAFLSFVRTNPNVALEMLSALTDRLRRTDELLRSRVHVTPTKKRGPVRLLQTGPPISLPSLVAAGSLLACRSVDHLLDNL